MRARRCLADPRRRCDQVPGADADAGPPGPPQRAGGRSRPQRRRRGMVCFKIDLCLTTSLEARFELAFARRDDKHAHIGLLQSPTNYAHAQKHQRTHARARIRAHQRTLYARAL